METQPPPPTEVIASEFNPTERPVDPIKDMRVAGSSNAKDLAGSIAKTCRVGQRVRMCAIGAQAVCQAVKAIPIANGYLAPQGIFLVAKVYFMDKQLERDGSNETRTSMVFELLPHAM